MKKALIFHSFVTLVCYAYTFIVLSSSLSGCKHQPDEVAPDRYAGAEPVIFGFNNLPLIKPDTEGSFTVTASLCRNTLPAEPKNLTVDVFSFDKATDPLNAIQEIAEPVDNGDDEGPDAQEIREPDQSFDLLTSTTDDKGKPATNFQADKAFVFLTDSQALCVVRITDEVGNESFSWFLTTQGTALKTCLKL